MRAGATPLQRRASDGGLIGRRHRDELVSLMLLLLRTHLSASALNAISLSLLLITLPMMIEAEGNDWYCADVRQRLHSEQYCGLCKQESDSIESLAPDDR